MSTSSDIRPPLHAPYREAAIRPPPRRVIPLRLRLRLRLANRAACAGWLLLSLSIFPLQHLAVHTAIVPGDEGNLTFGSVVQVLPTTSEPFLVRVGFEVRGEPRTVTAYSDVAPSIGSRAEVIARFEDGRCALSIKGMSTVDDCAPGQRRFSEGLPHLGPFLLLTDERELFSPGLPVLGILLACRGRRRTRRLASLLRRGQLTDGVLIAAEISHKLTGSKMISTIPYEFEAATGGRHSLPLTLDANLPVPETAAILHDPASPDDAVLVATLPGAPRIDSQGRITGVQAGPILTTVVVIVAASVALALLSPV